MKHPAIITSAELAKTFVLGGKATFTIKSGKTGTHLTYKIRLSKDKRVYFVSAMVGTDNEGDYQYCGIIREGVFIVAKDPSKVPAVKVAAIQWFLNKVLNGNLPDSVELWHNGHCARCARLLTVPESIAIGFGPECVKYIRKV